MIVGAMQSASRLVHMGTGSLIFEISTLIQYLLARANSGQRTSEVFRRTDQWRKQARKSPGMVCLLGDVRLCGPFLRHQR